MFLAEAKREWVRKGGVKLGTDSAAHYDFMRAMEVIADVPNGTLEKAALRIPGVNTQGAPLNYRLHGRVPGDP